MSEEMGLRRRLREVLDGKQSDKEICNFLRECENDPNAAAHRLLEDHNDDEPVAHLHSTPISEASDRNLKIQPSRDKMDLEGSSSQTPESALRNLREEHNELQRDREPVATLHSTSISEALDRIVLDIQPSRDSRQSTLGESIEANDLVNSIVNV